MGGATSSIGIIGLGSLGLVLARNLMARGHALVGYRRSDPARFIAAGGTAVDSPRAVAAAAPVIVTCLPNEAALAQALDGILAVGAPLLIEMSTFTIAFKEACKARLEAAGGAMVDCPVSGIPPAVLARKGLLFASGDADAMARAHPILKDISDRVIDCGAFGNGLKYKYVVNYLVGVHTWTMIESVALAERLGLDSAAVVETIKGSAGSSYQFDARAQVLPTRQFPEPVSATRNLLKDLHIIADVARETGLGGTLLDGVIPHFEAAVAAGLGDKDVVEMIRLLVD